MAGLWLLPEHGLGVYVAYNSDRGGEARGELWEAFLDYAFPAGAPVAPEPAAPEPIASRAPDLERFAGVYASNRLSTTTPARLFKLVSVITVAVDGQDLVTTPTGMEPQRWAAAGDREFAAVDGSARMVFSDDGSRPSHVVFDGPSTGLYSPLQAWAATAWYDRAVLHAGLLAASLLLIVSALAVWTALALARRRRQAPRPTGAVIARWWAAVTGGLYLLFVAAAVLTAGAVVHAALAWKRGHWSVAGRVHYTLLTLGFVSLAWQLSHWNLLGFHA